MAILDKMVLHCCGDCSNGHGTSYVDYNLDGKQNFSTKPAKHDMTEAIDHVTDLHFPVHGYSDQRKYLGTYKYVPVVESPGAAFIVRYDSFDAPNVTTALFNSWPLAVVVVVFVLLSGLLYWMLVSETKKRPPDILILVADHEFFGLHFEDACC